MSETQIISAVLEVAKSPGAVSALAASYFCKDVINEVLKNIAIPASQSIGQLLKNAVDLTTFQHPVSKQVASNIAQATLKLTRKLTTFNPDDFVLQISPEIAVPILNKLSYFESGDLRELLINLLAKSMLKTGQVHPTIVSIIDRLTTSEAKILSQLCESGQQGPWPCLTVKAAMGPREDGYSLPDLASFDISDQNATEALFENVFMRDRRENTGFWDIGGQYLASLGANHLFESFETTNFCVSNLKALGLVEVTQGYLTDKAKYVQLLIDSKDLIKIALNKSTHTPIFERDKLSITPIGSKIIEAFCEVKSDQ
jgi:Abortive infection alpha